MATCAAANSDAALYTGTLAGGDLAYTPVNSGSSSSVCQPEKAKFACERPPLVLRACRSFSVHMGG